ncbi:MAG TPA: hypothetical protein VFK40_11320 [Nitrososphaeraceae archaeon]|nr:hypothetical protein [Nitrososphaeraceae archaeon]
MLTSLGTIMIVPKAMALGDYDITNQNMRYIDNMANNNSYKSQNSDNSPSSKLKDTFAISPLQQQPTDSPLIFYRNDPSIISQAIGNLPELIALEKKPGDSPNLTAMEKITKLKTQWLGLVR